VFRRRWIWSITARLATAVGADKGIGRKGDRVRFDPNGVFSAEQAIRFGRAIEDLNNDYYEDPVLRHQRASPVREMVRIPTATNTVVVGFEQLSRNISTAPSTSSSSTHFLGRHSPVRQGGRQCARRSSSASPFTAAASWGFSFRRCCISAR
jgi:hypothetical protein